MERDFRRLTIELGARHCRARVYQGVMCHLMFGVEVLAAGQLLRMVQQTGPPSTLIRKLEVLNHKNHRIGPTESKLILHKTRCTEAALVIDQYRLAACGESLPILH